MDLIIELSPNSHNCFVLFHLRLPTGVLSSQQVWDPVSFLPHPDTCCGPTLYRGQHLLWAFKSGWQRSVTIYPALITSTQSSYFIGILLRKTYLK